LRLCGQQQHIQAYVAALGSVPVTHAKKIESGRNDISEENYVMLDMEVLGIKMQRPMLVVSGLDQIEVVLGWDTIRRA
jgi:hypothetical protein